VDVVRALLGDDPVEHRSARRYPAGAKATPENLRERVAVDHVRRCLRAQRRPLLALESKVRVQPVLDDEEAVPTDQGQEPPAALRREVAAGRVV
jgi:hypothetical protein